MATTRASADPPSIQGRLEIGRGSRLTDDKVLPRDGSDGQTKRPFETPANSSDLVARSDGHRWRRRVAVPDRAMCTWQSTRSGAIAGITWHAKIKIIGGGGGMVFKPSGSARDFTPAGSKASVR
jgi:hypothetical protein